MFSRPPLCTLAAIAIAALAGCAESERAERDILSARSLDEIRESGELVVLTTEGPTSWEGNAGNAAGYEVDLTRAAAEALDVEVRYEVHEDIESVLEAIANGEGDLAAAGITVTEARRERLDFGPVYKTVREQLVCNRDAGRIRE
ncbi:MAG TPA: membrane-bound lytic murein transglycosylase MltF, partial [Alphaproteobacteria bacterium]|nr:membrane-bound lytic murein transglycosylase MltF [Alphaproteobacteria bacterium]